MMVGQEEGKERQKQGNSPIGVHTIEMVLGMRYGNTSIN